MIKSLLFIWQLPQNLIAIFIILFHKVTKSTLMKKSSFGITWWTGKRIADSGVSLGDFIFMDSDRRVCLEDLMHEHGHQTQSKILGPLYLIVIGIPSAIGNIIDRMTHNKHKNKCWYYKQPWEAWADKAGNVNRSRIFHVVYTPTSH